MASSAASKRACASAKATSRPPDGVADSPTVTGQPPQRPECIVLLVQLVEASSCREGVSVRRVPLSLKGGELFGELHPRRVVDRVGWAGEPLGAAVGEVVGEGAGGVGEVGGDGVEVGALAGA